MPRKAKTHLELRCYRFACPDCGMTDQELGHLVTHDEVHCMVCLIDDERHVVLRRWLADNPEAPAVRAALAAGSVTRAG